jgi:hypothetical protein
MECHVIATDVLPALSRFFNNKVYVNNNTPESSKDNLIPANILLLPMYLFNFNLYI